jgi:NADPH-dependent 2,4-dienoyl-CoA reductase/sulfur reductase-like enzyme
VIVGASLAGLRAAEQLRREGFAGPLTLIGQEVGEPYDRPPLSKQVLLGRVPPERTCLPRAIDLEAEWLLGVPAVGLDRHRTAVELADGREVGYDRLLVATGVRNRPWPIGAQADLDGVVSIRTSGDAARLAALLAERPRRVLVIGGGFTGSEVASVCRQRDLAVTLVERGPALLVGALGGLIGHIAAQTQRAHGVDLRCGLTVDALEGDGDGRLRQATLSDGSRVDVDVAVVALGAVRTPSGCWSRGSPRVPVGSPATLAAARSTSTASSSTMCSRPEMSHAFRIRCTTISSSPSSTGRTQWRKRGSPRTTW